MRVAIVGSRDYPDENAVREYVRSLPSDTIVVSGGARGVDSWAADEAWKQKLAIRIYRAKWEKHGRRAGFLRNLEIVANADRIVAFWDGMSNGTRHTIDLARRSTKPVEIRSPA